MRKFPAATACTALLLAGTTLAQSSEGAPPAAAAPATQEQLLADCVAQQQGRNSATTREAAMQLCRTRQRPASVPEPGLPPKPSGTSVGGHATPDTSSPKTIARPAADAPAPKRPDEGASPRPKE
jgi:hypothetical protein